MQTENPQYDFEKGELAEKVKRLQEALNPTPEAAAQIEADNAAMGGEEQKEIKGSDVDWEDYDLNPDIAHHYRNAVFRQVGDEFRWIASLPEFRTVSKAYSASGYVEKTGEPKNLGEFLTWITNGPEGWRIAQILPNGLGSAAILLQRVSQFMLPDPIPLAIDTTVADVTDTELEEMEKASLTWAGENDQQTSDGETS